MERRPLLLQYQLALLVVLAASATIQLRAVEAGRHKSYSSHPPQQEKAKVSISAGLFQEHKKSYYHDHPAYHKPSYLKPTTPTYNKPPFSYMPAPHYFNKPTFVKPSVPYSYKPAPHYFNKPPNPSPPY